MMLALIGLTAIAAVPKFDPGWCARVAEQVPGYSYTIEAQCESGEETAKQKLEQISAPSETWAWCTRVATAGGPAATRCWLNASMRSFGRSKSSTKLALRPRCARGVAE